MAVPTPENFSAGAVSSDVNSAKAATLQALAAGGTNAAQQLAASQQYASNVTGQAAQAAYQAATGAGGPQSPALGEQLAASAQAPAANFSQVMGSRTQAQQDFYGGLGGLVGDYADRVNAAIPLSQEVTQRQLNSLQAVAAEREQERALRMQEMQMQMAMEQKRLDAANAADDPNSVEGQLKQAELQGARLRNQSAAEALANGPKLSGQQADVLQRQALDSALNSVAGGPNSRAAQALAGALSGSGAADEGAALNNLTYLTTPQKGKDGKVSTRVLTPGGNTLDQAYMKAQVRAYFDALNRLMGAGGSSSPNAYYIPNGGAGPVLGS